MYGGIEMIRVFVLAIFMFIMPTFAAEMPVRRIFVYPDVLEYAINKHFSVMDRDRVAQEWENRMDSNGMVTPDDIRAVCKAGRIGDAECNAFQKDVMTYFYNVCEKNADKGKSDCINDFWAAVWGTWVRLPEAIGISKEYALLKNNEKIVCSPSPKNVNPPAQASYVKCTSVDGTHFYTFKDNSTSEKDDKNIISGTLRAVGKIHDVEFNKPVWSLGTIATESDENFSYDTSDPKKCSEINKSLAKFGFSSRMWDKPNDIYGPICVVDVFQSGQLRTAYGINNKVFEGVQYAYDADLEKYIKQYVQHHMNSSGQKLSSFSCDYSTRLSRTNPLNERVIGGKTDRDEYLTCYVNEQPVDFVFDDLSESRGRKRDSGLAQMTCATLGGRYQGKECRGFDEAKCREISAKIPGGTRWNATAEVCILNDAAKAQNISDAAWLVGDVVVAAGLIYISGGSYVLVLIGAAGAAAADLAFVAYDQLLAMNPTHRARQFAEDAKKCNIPVDAKSCTSTQVSCAKNVINKHFSRLDEILDQLNDKQVEAVGDIAVSLTDCLSDRELSDALTTSTPMLEDKILNAGGILLMAAAVFCAPENAVNNLVARSPKFARIFSRCRMVERTSSTLNGARYMRIYADNLDMHDIELVVDGLRSRGTRVSSNMTEDGRRFIAVADRDIFGPWNNIPSNWLFGGASRRGSIGMDLHDVLIRSGIRPYSVQRGFFQVNLRSGRQCMTGLKFHVSVRPDDLERATFIVNDLVARTNVADIWKVGLNGMGGSQLGKDFTIYVSQSGYDQRAIQNFLNELESQLRRSSIGNNGFGSHVVSGDRAVPGSNYINYRYDRTNSRGIPDGVYNDSYQFVAPNAQYAGDIMNGIWVQ